MTFLELYGDELDQELGSADRLQLFTIARRKAAINRAQLEFARLTGCVIRTVSQTLIDDQKTFILDSVTGGPVIRVRDGRIDITTAGVTKTLSGQDFSRKSRIWLDRHELGWRQAVPGTPRFWFEDRESGSISITFTPPLDLLVGSTAAFILDVSVEPPVLVADVDEPFTAIGALNGYHKALAHFAAAQLEKLRRNYTVSDFQHNLFNGYVVAYLQENSDQGRLDGDSEVSFDRDYLGEASRHNVMLGDPRR